jgi:hypothetical protein
MARLDAASPDQLGWDCFGAAGEGVFPQGVPVTWAPGMGAIEFPGGAGIEFAVGDVLVVQMHYNLLAGDRPDATQIRLKWADEVDREGYQILFDPFLFTSIQGSPASLEPGQASVTYTWDESFRQMLSFAQLGHLEDLELLGIVPHMHKRGRRMSITVERPDGRECAAQVDRWDFNWQRAYFYEQPIEVHADDKLHVVCDWNTNADRDPVLPGFGTDDEMCLVGLYFAKRP